MGAGSDWMAFLASGEILVSVLLHWSSAPPLAVGVDDSLPITVCFKDCTPWAIVAVVDCRRPGGFSSAFWCTMWVATLWTVAGWFSVSALFLWSTVSTVWLFALLLSAIFSKARGRGKEKQNLGHRENPRTISNHQTLTACKVFRCQNEEHRDPEEEKNK
jgi:hypothetical protein